MKKTIIKLIEKYKEKIKHHEQTNDLRQHGHDEFGYDHGKCAALYDVINDLEEILNKEE